MRYQVEIEETTSRVIEIEAGSAAEAKEMVDRKYRNSEIVLGGDDFVDCRIRLV